MVNAQAQRAVAHQCCCILTLSGKSTAVEMNERTKFAVLMNQSPQLKWKDIKTEIQDTIIDVVSRNY